MKLTIYEFLKIKIKEKHLVDKILWYSSPDNNLKKQPKKYLKIRKDADNRLFNNVVIAYTKLQFSHITPYEYKRVEKFRLLIDIMMAKLFKRKIDRDILGTYLHYYNSSFINFNFEPDKMFYLF